MKQRIFILWASWNVWRELINQILEKDSKWNHINPSEIVWIANSNMYIFNSRWVDEDILKKISKWRKEATQLFNLSWEKFDKITLLLDLVKEEWLDWEIVFADVTAGKEELLEFHKVLISNTQNFLVTANKNPISLYDIKDFKYLTSYKWRYDTNTTVMWWAGILNFVDERADKIIDDILNIEWMFSWTLWYILSELEKLEKPFSTIVKDAKENGYTEPNPWDDLNGLDVARKLIILARYAWHDVSINDVKIKPLIDERYAKYDWEDFLKAIQEEDNSFKKQVLDSKKRWEVLRYIWEMIVNGSQVKLKVWLKSISKNSDLWTLAWTSNLAIVETDILRRPLPHVIKSRWAGLAVTAWAVRVWIAKMLPNHIKTR